LLLLFYFKEKRKKAFGVEFGNLSKKSISKGFVYCFFLGISAKPKRLGAKAKDWKVRKLLSQER